MFENKLDTDPYLDRLEASDPALYSEILLEFLKRPETRVAITRHEKTPSEILKIIASDNGAPWIEILSHPNCPPDLIKQRLKKGNQDELISIAQNCLIDESLIRELAKSAYSPVLTWVCRRPDCPPRRSCSGAEAQRCGCRRPLAPHGPRERRRTRSAGWRPGHRSRLGTRSRRSPTDQWDFVRRE